MNEEVINPVVKKLINAENNEQLFEQKLFVDKETQSELAESVNHQCTQTTRKMQYLMGLLLA